VTEVPATAVGAEAALVSRRSAMVVTLVVTVAVLLAVLGSFEVVVTVAVLGVRLATWPFGTVPVIVIVAEAPLANEACVHVTVAVPVHAKLDDVAAT
jgi:hypothetical protein